uniref:Leukotriene C4 synthase n=1 Tax=Equus asinus TaxID=9793 RepID=A0A9L0K578_EQUAS
MKDEVALLAAVTLLGVLQQAYFSLQVISARRLFRVSPPLTTGPPEFERVYRAQVNCSEYFPLFLATLWVAGIFFHEGLSTGQGRAPEPQGPASVLTAPRPPRSQARRPCAAWSTCWHASATFRATRARRSKGEGPGGAPGGSAGRGRAARGPGLDGGPGGRGRRAPRGAAGGAPPRPAPPPLSTSRRLAPLYASARALWLLLALAALGLLAHFVPAALRAALLGRLRTVLPRA